MSKRLVGEKLSTSLRRYKQVNHFLTSSDSPSQILADECRNDKKLSARSHVTQVLASMHLLVSTNSEELKISSPILRKAMNFITTSESIEEITEAFLLVMQSTDEKLSEAMLSALCFSLIKIQAKKLLGERQYGEIIKDASTCNGGERWSGLTSDEEHCVALFHCKRLIRYGEKGGSFDKELQRTVEGKDNENANRILYHIRKAVGNSISVSPIAALTDLMYLDISWPVAQRIYSTCKELNPANLEPPMEMIDRLMGLMTCYKTNNVGSRPWSLALQLYEHALHSGYNTTLATHTHALDALWRSGDTYQKQYSSLTDSHREWIWKEVERVQSNVKAANLRISGDGGCAYMESLIKASGAAGKWEFVLSLLSEMELSVEDTSSRLLIPTPETLLFAVASCNSVRHKTHSEGLLRIYEAHYSFSDAHSEALLVFLQSLHHLLRFPDSNVGSIMDRIWMAKNETLSRPCILAFFQLLSSQKVVTKETKTCLALELFKLYDSSVWLQEPLPRKVELETIFRCCYLIEVGKSPLDSTSLIHGVRQRLQSVFGPSSMEEEWLNQTEIYALQRVDDWQRALGIFERCFSSTVNRNDSPIPFFQAKQSLINAILRSCRGVSLCNDGNDTSFLLDEEERVQQCEEVEQIATVGVEKAVELFPGGDCLQETIGELLLLHAAHTKNSTKKKGLLDRSLKYFSIAPQHCLTPSIIRLIAKVTGLSEAHVRESMAEGHYAMRRGTLLSDMGKSKASCLEMF